MLGGAGDGQGLERRGIERPLTNERKNPMNRLIHASISGLLVAAIWTLATGCKSEIVPSSGSRTPTSPEQVKIYEKQPKRYEMLGTVSVPVGGEVRWDDRGHAKAGFDKLKQRAAALGANGLLLKVPEDQSDFLVLAGD